MSEEKPVDIVRWAWGLRRFAAWGLVVAVLAGLAGIFVTRSAPVQSVRAVALLAGQPPASLDLGVVQHWNSFYGLTMTSYGRLATSEKVLAPVAAKHGRTVADLQPLVSGRLVPGSMLVEVRYTGTSEQDAKAVLGDIVESLIPESAKDEFAFANAGPITLKVAQPPSTNLETTITSEADAAAASNASKSTIIRLAMVAAVALALGLATTIALALASRRRRSPAA